MLKTDRLSVFAGLLILQLARPLLNSALLPSLSPLIRDGGGGMSAYTTAARSTSTICGCRCRRGVVSSSSSSFAKS